LKSIVLAKMKRAFLFVLARSPEARQVKRRLIFHSAKVFLFSFSGSKLTDFVLK